MTKKPRPAMSHKLSELSLPSVPWYEDAAPRRELPPLATPTPLPWMSTAVTTQQPTIVVAQEHPPVDLSQLNNLTKKYVGTTKKLVPAHSKRRHSKPTPRPSLHDFFNYVTAFQNAHNTNNPTLIVQLIRARCDLNFEHTSYRIHPETKIVDEATRIRNVGLKAYMNYLERLAKFVLEGVTTVGKPEYLSANTVSSKVYVVQFPYVYKGTLVLCEPTVQIEESSSAKTDSSSFSSSSSSSTCVSEGESMTGISTKEEVDYTQLFLEESTMLPVDEEFFYDDDTTSSSRAMAGLVRREVGVAEDSSPDEFMDVEPVTRRENFLLMTFEEIADKASIFFPAPTESRHAAAADREQQSPALSTASYTAPENTVTASSPSSSVAALPLDSAEEQQQQQQQAAEVCSTQLEIRGMLKLYVLQSNHKIVKMEYVYQ